MIGLNPFLDSLWHLGFKNRGLHPGGHIERFPGPQGVVYMEGGKILDAGGGGREKSIKDSVIMMEIEINRFSIYKTTSFVEFSDFILHFWINNTFG